MECHGVCQADGASYFKVTCPGPNENVPQKLMILKDGKANKEYKNICQKPQQSATIAYNTFYWFKIDMDGKILEYPWVHQRGYTIISTDREILSSFFENYHITPKWIYCNQTWGLFDKETGHWTGAVGKVCSRVAHPGVKSKLNF